MNAPAIRLESAADAGRTSERIVRGANSDAAFFQRAKDEGKESGLVADVPH